MSLLTPVTHRLSLSTKNRALLKTFLLLGANLGDRAATLRQAVKLIEYSVGRVPKRSLIYETAPWGVTDQPAFLNQVILVETALEPESVLQQTQAIEQELGRVRLEKWSARTIDIDILYYDHLIWQSATLMAGPITQPSTLRNTLPLNSAPGCMPKRVFSIGCQPKRNGNMPVVPKQQHRTHLVPM